MQWGHQWHALDPYYCEFDDNQTWGVGMGGRINGRLEKLWLLICLGLGAWVRFPLCFAEHFFPWRREWESVSRISSSNTNFSILVSGSCTQLHPPESPWEKQKMWNFRSAVSVEALMVAPWPRSQGNGTSHISGVGLLEYKAHNWIISLASPKPRPGNFSPGNISLPKEILASTQRPGLTTTSGKMKAAQKLSSCQMMPLLKIFLNICPTDLPFQYQDQNVCIDANILVLISHWYWSG